MKPEQAQRLVDRIGVLRNRCDLDLLLFFVRHPYTLLTSDQLATFLGQDVKAVGESLDVLLAAGFLKRSQHPNYSARLFAFSAEGHHGGWLPALVEAASTREGRLAIIDALDHRSGAQARETTSRLAPPRMRIVKRG